MASSSVVGCCPTGETCSDTSGETSYYSSYTPTTSYQSASTYYQPYTTPYQTTVYETTSANGGVLVIPGGGTTVYTNEAASAAETTVYTSAYSTPTTVYTSFLQQTATDGFNDQAYCSTIIENGPGLPTTAAAQCGTVLITSAVAEAARFDIEPMKIIRMMIYIGALHGMGGLLFGLRR